MYINTLQISSKIIQAALATLAFAVVLLGLTTYTHAQSLEGSIKCGSNVDYSSKDAAACADKQKAQATAKCAEQHPESASERQKCVEEATKASSKRLNNVLATVINVMSALGGAIAILAIILGGLNYVTSQGDAQKASSARSYIMYALIGLIVIAFAQIIVQFVLGRTSISS